MHRYTISTDTELLDFETIFSFISTQSYWGKGRSRDAMKTAIDNSTLCFGVYDQEINPAAQVGFARVISDLTVFGYIADLFILQEHRNKGLGKLLVKTITNHECLRNLRRLTLITRTPEFYANHNFKLFQQTPDTQFMEIVNIP